MTDEQILRNKLALWEVPGFNHFIEDLGNYIDILDVERQVEVLKRLYKTRLEEMQKKSKFSQTKLVFNE